MTQRCWLKQKNEDYYKFVNMGVMVFQNLFVLTLKICSKTYDCFNPSYLLIKILKGPS
jgi:hypothetical protein